MLDSSNSSCILLISTADFGAKLWTNKQRIAMELSKDRKVFYLNSMGLRKPQLTLSDLRRLFLRIFSIGGKSPRAAKDLEVINPLVLPFSGKLASAVNHLSLRLQIVRKIRHYDKVLIWTFSPVTFGLDELGTATVYHSVDLLHTVPKVNSERVLEAEMGLVSRSAVSIASSIGLVEHLKGIGADNIILWENVGSLENLGPQEPRRDRGIFIGHLTDVKVDFELVGKLLDSGNKLAFAGPKPIDGTQLPANALKVLSHKNLELLGTLGPGRLGVEVAMSKYAIVPYKLDEHTRGIYPLKIYEYLSTGTPTVSTALYSLINTPNKPVGLFIENSDSAFIQRCRDLSVANDVQLEEQIISAAKNHTWETRGKECRDLAKELLAIEDD